MVIMNNSNKFHFRTNENYSGLPEIPGEVLYRIETNILKYSIGVLVVYVDNFFLLTGIYGELVCARILTIIKDNLKNCFDKYFLNCRIILIQNDSPNQHTVWFVLLDNAVASLSCRAEMLRESLLHHIFQHGYTHMSPHLDIAVGYSWIPKNHLDDLRLACFRAFCDAHRSSITIRKTGLLKLHQEFFQILEHSDFRIFYTPVVHLLSGDIIGWDVYISGQEKTFFNSWKRLYQYAEETGNLFVFQMKMLTFVFQNLTNISADQKIFINVHLNTIVDPLFNIDSVIGLFKKYRIKPEHVVFKFSNNYGKLPLLNRNIDYCRQFGCDVLLDEIGTGHLSLKNISDIKPEYLKIDLSLVNGIENNPVNRVIIESYCLMAQSVGAHVIAGGIESVAELQTLALLGVELGQGVLIAESSPELGSIKKVRPPVRLFLSEKDENSDNSVHVIDLVQPAIQASPDTSIEEIKDLLKNSPPMSSVVIVKDRKPMGLLMKYNLDRKLGTRFGVSLFYQREANRLMDRNPLTVDKDQALETVAQLAMTRSPQNIYDDIIVTDNDLLVGTVSVQKMLETLSEVAIRERDAAKADNKRIQDSLRYAKLIQKAMLPSKEKLEKFLQESFYIWLPRDMVGGDMFLMEPCKDGFALAVMDCTGHGVPGAFMTMIASSPLRIMMEKAVYSPAEMLKHLNTAVKTTLHQDSPFALSDDGLDIAVCLFNQSQNILTYAGARLPLVYIHHDKIHVIKGNKQSIGYIDSDLNYCYTDHQIHVTNNMRFYLYTDGIVDQLGGSDRFPFGASRFCNLLLQISPLSFLEQENTIIETFQKHKGENDQQDDITVIGFRL